MFSNQILKKEIITGVDIISKEDRENYRLFKTERI